MFHVKPSAPQIRAICTGIATPLLMASAGGPPRSISTAIRKSPRSEADVWAGRLGLEGDEQADLSVHGGLDKAIYAYPREHWPLWATATGTALTEWTAGRLGENLSTEGVTDNEVWVGDLWHQGDVVLRVTAPRVPCHKLAAAIRLPTAARLMYDHACSGWYLAVLSPGPLRPGPIEIEPGPRNTTIAKALARTRRPGHE